MRSPHDHGLTDGARHGHDRRRLFLLLAPVVVLFIANVIGIAFAPMLLGRAPLVLIALSPLVRHLVLASSSVDAVPFFTVGIVRSFAMCACLYLIGREYGPEAVSWVKSRSRAAARVMRFTERAFARAGVLVVVASPGPLVSLLAGAERMPLATFIAASLVGTATLVLLIRSFGIAFAAKLALVRSFIDANIVGLTIVSIALVLARIAARRRRRAHT